MEDGQIKVKIAVRIDYKPSRQIKIVGYAYCGLDYLGNGFSLKKGSVYYRAAKDCRITDPRDVAERTGSIPSPTPPAPQALPSRS